MIAEYSLLIPIFLLCSFGAWLSYTEYTKSAPWYVPLMAVLGAGCAALFAIAARRMSKTEVYTYSLWYDGAVAFAYYLLPVLIWDAKLTAGIVVGTLLVVSGLVVVKFYG